MISAVLTVAFFYSLLWIFERKRIGFDFFDIATVTMAPISASFLVGFGLRDLGLEIRATVAALLILAIATYFLLTKMLTLGPRRAAAYALAVSVFQIITSVFGYPILMSTEQ